MGTENRSGTGQLSSALRALVFGSGLIVLCCAVTLGLLRLSSRNTTRDDQATAQGEPVMPDNGAVQPAGLPLAQNPVAAEPIEPAIQSAARILPASSARIESPAAITPSGMEYRLSRIERQLSDVVDSVRSPDNPIACRPNESAVPAEIRSMPVTLAQALSESLRSSARENHFQQELTELRLANALSLQGLQQKLDGISEGQKRLTKSLRSRGRGEAPAAASPRDNGHSAVAEVIAPARARMAASVSRDEVVSPGESKSAVTVDSRNPLRISVRTRSTTLAHLLSQFARATDCELVMATGQDYEIQAISLNSIEPQILFSLLSHDRPFEIHYVEGRISLKKRPQTAPIESTVRNSLSPFELAEAALMDPRPSEPSQTAAAATSEAENFRPISTPEPAPAASRELPAGQITPPKSEKPATVPTPSVRKPARRPATPEATPPSTEVTSPTPQTVDRALPGDGKPSDEAELLRPLGSPLISRLSSRPEVNEPRATPAPEASAIDLPGPSERESEAGLRERPPLENAATPEMEPALIPLQRASREQRQRFELFATVMHITLTNTGAIEPEGIFPIHLHRTRRPGHDSAVRQVLDQAGRIGRVTPVTEASVKIEAGRSARLKIGSQCLHCNTEYGVEAGDTLRVSVLPSSENRPSLRVQGLAAESGEVLATLRTDEAPVPESGSFLVCEKGTSGFVDMIDKSSRMTKLPLIGHRFEKSKRVRQIAQRFIVLTLRPTGQTQVAETDVPSSIQRASRSERSARLASGISQTDSFTEESRGASRVSASDRAGAVPAPRPLQFSLPTLPAPALPESALSSETVPTEFPPVDEMPIHESEAAGLLPAPPAEDEDEIHAEVDLEFYAPRRPGRGEPALIDKDAVREVHPAALSQVAEISPQAHQITPVAREENPRSRLSGVQRAYSGPEDYSSNDAGACPDCHPFFFPSEIVTETGLEEDVTAPLASRPVRRHPGQLAASRRPPSNDFREGLDLSFPEDD